jgi:DNA-binding SARP family transcriptional activator/DNA-binding CsgD family transcriptional regulator
MIGRTLVLLMRALCGVPEASISLDEHLRYARLREPVARPATGYTRKARMRTRPQRQQQRGGHTGAARSEPEAIRIELLGGFHLWVGPRVLEESGWRLRKARSLAKLLALSAGHRLHREQVMEALWPELGMHKASNNLHQTLHVARRALEPSALASGSASPSSYLLLRDEQLTLCPDSPVWVDVEAFEEAASAARQAMEPHAYRAAIDLYVGELLPEDRYEPWLEEPRAQLRELYLSLLLELGALDEERGEFGEAVEALGRVVTEEPTHEGANLGIMRLHALSGRRRQALRQYERLREALFIEFGREPEAATRRLQQEIWAGTFPHYSDLPPTGFPPGEEAPSPAGAARHNLPLARTSFIRRERQEAATDYEGRLGAAPSQLDEEIWSGGWVQGKAMPLKNIIEYALSDDVERERPALFAVPEQQPPPSDERTERLTAREREVAVLVGEGLTNRRIAMELSISERTVENHIAKILKKLGYSSRARIASWVAQR